MSGLLQRVRAALGRRPEPAHLQTGRWGEARAADFLRARGMRILGRRVRAGERGEIDLLAQDGEVLVFVEVKTRADESFGRAATAVDRRKQRRLARAARDYLLGLKTRPRHFRFDVVEVVGVAGGADPAITHIAHAFTPDPSFRLPW